MSLRAPCATSTSSVMADADLRLPNTELLSSVPEGTVQNGVSQRIFHWGPVLAPLCGILAKTMFLNGDMETAIGRFSNSQLGKDAFGARAS